jgi:hypothetical protein
MELVWDEVGIDRKAKLGGQSEEFAFELRIK